MKIKMRCRKCKEEKIVNGQKGIDQFREAHTHGDRFANMTGKFIEVIDD